MNNRNDNRREAKQTMLALFVVFFAIVLRDAVMGTLSLFWTVLMGGVIISIFLFSLLLVPKDPNAMRQRTIETLKVKKAATGIDKNRKRKT